MKIKDKNVVIDLYEKNLSNKEISLKLGVSEGCISKIIRRMGLKRDKSVLILNKLSIDIDYFKSVNNNEKAYWLGFICADGNISKLNNKMTLTSKDLEVVEKFKKCIKSEHKISYYDYIDKRTKKRYSRYSIQVTTKPFTTNLINLGITKDKTDKLSFPEIEEKYYPCFIAGMFDGDGTICNRRKNNQLLISLISTMEILNFIQIYLNRNFNINETKIQRVTKNNKKNVHKMCLYKRDDILKFLNFIYKDDIKDIYLQRKYKIYKKELERT